MLLEDKIFEPFEKLNRLIQPYLEPRAQFEFHGMIDSLTPTSCKIIGLSKIAKINSFVQFANKSFGQVIQIEADYIIAKPFSHLNDIYIGSRVLLYKKDFAIKPDISWLGTVINALGEPIQTNGPFYSGLINYHIDASPPQSVSRARVTQPLLTSVLAMDIFTPICMGQRIGIFAGSGVGKTTLLAMIARSSDFDIIIIALVGERGREVREFLETAVHQHRDRCVVIVSTSDESALMRRMAPKTAMAIAEFFRDQGKSVLLIVDSITRYAHALREVGLSIGEPPVAHGFPPSVFAELPRLLERAGPGQEQSGTITAIFAVLVDGDNHNDPIADNIRGTLDGHIILDRKIANQGRYPAINLLSSLSRLAHNVWSKEENKLIVYLRHLIHLYEESHDLRSVGLYQAGNDAETDKAIHLIPIVYEALNQSITAPFIKEPFKYIAQTISNATEKQ
jgi:flagellum-specific ATP synthase